MPIRASAPAIMAHLRIATFGTSILAAALAICLLQFADQSTDLLATVRQGALLMAKSFRSRLLVQRAVPDTTAVVLNWSRLPNVIRIASLLCDESLDDVVASVVIWNNNPEPLTHEDFALTGCPAPKLKIHNSPENLYFQARFLACSKATTEFCFIQDDDYMVWPPVVQSLHARMIDSDVRGIHLLPPHEHLSSTLQTVIAPPNIHTRFAWLGHGAMIRRSLSTEFLRLLAYLKANDEQHKMADNYYTILSNTFAEIWFDQGYELGGGQPFTVGTEGDLRNQRHIASAVQMLDQIFAGEPSPCTRGVTYVDCSTGVDMPKFTYAPCKSTSCIFQTNIQILPVLPADGLKAADLGKLAMENEATLDPWVKEHYLGFAPSSAVDGDPNTAFQSLYDARAGDFIVLFAQHRIRCVEAARMSFLVNPETEDILRYARFATSVDPASWDRAEAYQAHLKPYLRCQDYLNTTASAPLRLCTAEVSGAANFYRVELPGTYEGNGGRWTIHEVSLTVV